MTADNHKKQVFLSTIPKAGTYLVAEFIAQLGYCNTGYHIAFDHYLDTKNFDYDTNSEAPSKTVKSANFAEVLEDLKPGDMAFGHLNPLDFPNDLRGNFHFVCGYRAPRLTLISEFIDFRFRRKDVEWLSTATVSDDKDAFDIYLKNHGQKHRSIWARFLAFHGFQQRQPPTIATSSERVMFYDFAAVLSPQTGPAQLQRLAAFLGTDLDSGETVRTHQRLLQTRTKTSSHDMTLDLPRAELWTPAADRLYGLMGFPTVEDYISRHLSPETSV